MAQSAKLYDAIGRHTGCRALATAFYAQVERDPVLRPLFPSTFTCAVEAFAAFLVQFLGGEAEHTQRRWFLSLRESHSRFSIGERERKAWLRAMTVALSDGSVIADAGVRRELLDFFELSSAHIVNQGRAPEAPAPLTGELAPLWEEQVALDEAVGLINSQKNSARCLELLKGPILQNRFARSPAVHASVLALAAKSKTPVLREYVNDQLRAHPSLVHERYKYGRTLLHDASAAGDVSLVEQLLDMGAGKSGGDVRAQSPLYCVGNECTAPGGSQVVRILVQRTPIRVDEPYGVKRCTPLHMAARRGNVDVIGALLDCGANVEARDSAGDTPLRRAVNCKKVEAARLLLARGADPHSEGSRALTPARAARDDRMRQVFEGAQRPRGSVV